MAVNITREVVRERLHKACRIGSIASFAFLLAGLLLGALAALIGLGQSLPAFVANAVDRLLPAAADTIELVSTVGTQAALLFLIGLLGILMFRKFSKTEDTARTRQFRQLRVIAILFALLGVLPSVMGSVVKLALSVRAGSPRLELSLSFDVLCIVCGLFMWASARVLYYGAALQGMADEPAPASSAYVPSGTVYEPAPVGETTPVAPAASPAPVDATVEALAQQEVTVPPIDEAFQRETEEAFKREFGE